MEGEKKSKLTDLVPAPFVAGLVGASENILQKSVNIIVQYYSRLHRGSFIIW